MQIKDLIRASGYSQSSIYNWLEGRVVMSYGTACCLQALTGIRYSDWLACIPELRNLLKKAPYGSEAIKNFAGRMEGSDKGVGTAEEMVKFREWCNSPLKPLLSRK